MISVHRMGILLKKTELNYEDEGVLNPGVIKDDGRIHMFYRAVATGNRSTIGYCELSSPYEVIKRNKEPLLSPEYDYESQGLEDPRIVKVDNTFYLTYTAYNGTNALSALATSTDLIRWEKHGIIVPQITYDEFRSYNEKNEFLTEKYVRYNTNAKSHEEEQSNVYIWDKNLVLFPRKINNKLCFLHRVKPDIQIVTTINDFSELTKEFWEEYFGRFREHIVLKPKYLHETGYIGGGCPPIETPQGWLIIYHSVHDTIKGYVYSACAALLDLEDPRKEIARLPYPLFSPEREWELKGEVNNVCFPTGAIVEHDQLYIYYGAADERIAVASLNMNEVLAELMLHKI